MTVDNFDQDFFFLFFFLLRDKDPAYFKYISNINSLCNLIFYKTRFGKEHFIFYFFKTIFIKSLKQKLIENKFSRTDRSPNQTLTKL